MRKSSSITDYYTVRHPKFVLIHCASTFGTGGAPSQAVPSMADVDAERSARSQRNARLFKQGVRMFRVGHAQGDIIAVSSIDLQAGKATCKGLRRRIRTVALCDLYPMGA